MKCVVSLVGKVTCLGPGGQRRVVMYRKYSKKDQGEIMADMKASQAKGMVVGDCFTCKVISENGKCRSVVKKIKPKKLTKLQVTRIVNKVHRELDDLSF